MRSFNLPSSLASDPRETPEHPETIPPPSATALPPDRPPSGVPKSEAAPPPAWRKALTLVARVRASFARSEAVHQARLDACWNGPERHLLAHVICSAK